MKIFSNSLKYIIIHVLKYFGREINLKYWSNYIFEYIEHNKFFNFTSRSLKAHKLEFNIDGLMLIKIENKI